LKLEFDELLSTFAFNFNLRRYNKTQCAVVGKTTFEAGLVKLALIVRDQYGNVVVGRCRFTL